MIQRIQSIYLLLATIFAKIFVFLPFATSGENDLWLTDFDHQFDAIMIGVVGVAIFVSFVTIFLFRNRKLQLNFCRLAIVMLIAVLGLGAYAAYSIAGNDLPQYGAAFPVVAWLFLYLAMRGIRFDERLIRSQDRLR